jgi:hypothetical protein
MMTSPHGTQEHLSSPGYLRFTPNNAFQQDILAPILSSEAIERQHRISAGLLLSSVAIRSYQEIPRERALATLHDNAHQQFRDNSRLHPLRAACVPLFHPEIDEQTGNSRNILHGIDMQFALNRREREKLLTVIHPAIDQDELLYITDDSRNLHFVVRPQDLAFSPPETKKGLESHLSTVNQRLANQALRSTYYVFSEPNIVMR